MGKPLIEGGFYLKPRIPLKKELLDAPPHYREIYDWLNKEANHTDSNDLKRGQLVRTIKDIQDGLAWKVGYRTERYSRSLCENAMKWLRMNGMITTTKTTRGSIITVLGYNDSQNPKNYESRSESRTQTQVTSVVEPSLAERILDFWNSQKIIIHKLPANKLKCDSEKYENIVKSLKTSYTEKEIQQTILNYAFIQRNESGEFKDVHKWTLPEFLRRGFEKYVDWDVAYSNKKIRTENNNHNKPSEGDLAKVREYVAKTTA